MGRQAAGPRRLTPVVAAVPPAAPLAATPAAVGDAPFAAEPPLFDLPGRVLVDSGPLVARFNAADRWHAPVLQWLKQHPTVTLLTTWPVATEVCALLVRRLHNDCALDFLRWVQRGGVAFDIPGDRSLSDVLSISERFASLPFDLADASIAEAAARLRIRHILSIDADFDVYRDSAGQALTNVLRR